MRIRTFTGMDKGFILYVLLVTLSWRSMAESTVSSAAMSTTANSGTTTMAESTVMSTAMSTAANSGKTTFVENTAPAVSPNNTVQTLEADIDRTQCGSEQLCVAEPFECDPSATVSCFFLGAKRQRGRNFFFELSGESEGYIAATITDGNTKGDPTYICAKSKGRVQFIGALLNNTLLTRSELSVNSVKGNITGKRIQCSFLATVPDPMNRTTSIRLSVSTGDFNETDESLGAPSTVIKTNLVDLGNPNMTVINVISSNTTTPSLTAAGNNLTTTGPSNNATTAAPSNNATMMAGIPPLQAAVSKDGCDFTKLCVVQPSECDPSTGANCFFLSARQHIGQTFEFELSGQTSGYIAAGVSTAANKAGSHRAYICVNNSGAVRFLTGTIDNSVLNTTETLNSSNEKGTVNNGKIQCTFTAALPNTTSRASTQYSLSVTTGSYDASSGVFGKADFKVLTPLVNISDPAANVSNLLASDTSASSAVLVTPTKSFLPALLVTVCMLTFTIM
ncbi:mucin-19 [Fundulus heteroclitus]|uniref:mucin-19 n=1 Tax=Fundulus heteroclitus TaxID=8078 RepID=UPI00165CCDDF|nr:mucin-19 [Fundulus heteroclitus]